MSMIDATIDLMRPLDWPILADLIEGTASHAESSEVIVTVQGDTVIVGAALGVSELRASLAYVLGFDRLDAKLAEFGMFSTFNGEQALRYAALRAKAEKLRELLDLAAVSA